MARVKSHDTRPERLVRSILTDLGYRYRLNRPDIPGKPDIAFIGRRKAIFVHGCFWHGHDCKRGARLPKANAAYWTQKISGNVERDRRVAKDLGALGWKYLVIWECELRELAPLRCRLIDFLSSN